jgi:hypothetical protein
MSVATMSGWTLRDAVAASQSILQIPRAYVFDGALPPKEI